MIITNFLEDNIQSGMVAILGPPNAGKSTLMNYLLGQKISIVTHRPQTTRNRILGVVNDEKYQIPVRISIGDVHGQLQSDWQQTSHH